MRGLCHSCRSSNVEATFDVRCSLSAPKERQGLNGYINSNEKLFSRNVAKTIKEMRKIIKILQRETENNAGDS